MLIPLAGLLPQRPVPTSFTVRAWIHATAFDPTCCCTTHKAVAISLSFACHHPMCSHITYVADVLRNIGGDSKVENSRVAVCRSFHLCVVDVCRVVDGGQHRAPHRAQAGVRGQLRVVGELKCTYNAYYLLSILGALSVKTRHHKPPLRGGPPQAGEARHTRESGRRGAGGGAARSRVVVPACNCTLVYCVRENSF